MRTTTPEMNARYTRALALIKKGMTKTKAIQTAGLSAPTFYARQKKTPMTAKRGPDGKQYINITTQPKRFKKLSTMTTTEKRAELNRILKTLQSVSKQLERI